MITVIPRDKRHFKDFGWLQTHWLFSFSDYFDPQNVNHGILRVFNDDIVQPQNGFGTHPHEEMEIISVILRGEMIHKDTMGNELIVSEGDVQRMTAGTGVQHSEWNDSDKEVAFFQIWLTPDTPQLAPSYDQKNFTENDYHNRLQLLASNKEIEDTVHLNTDGQIYRASLDQGVALDYTTTKERAVFIYIIEGNLRVNEHDIGARDQVRVLEEEQLQITATAKCDVMLIDIPIAH